MRHIILYLEFEHSFLVCGFYILSVSPAASSSLLSSDCSYKERNSDIKPRVPAVHWSWLLPSRWCQVRWKLEKTGCYFGSWGILLIKILKHIPISNKKTCILSMQSNNTINKWVEVAVLQDREYFGLKKKMLTSLLRFYTIFIFRNLPEDFLPLVRVLTPPLLVFWEFLGGKSEAYLVKLFS